MAVKLIKYFFLSLSMLLAMAAAEIFLLRPVLDMISFDHWTQFTIYMVLLLLVNPLIVRLILDDHGLFEQAKSERDRSEI